MKNKFVIINLFISVVIVFFVFKNGLFFKKDTRKVLKYNIHPSIESRIKSERVDKLLILFPTKKDSLKIVDWVKFGDFCKANKTVKPVIILSSDYDAYNNYSINDGLLLIHDVKNEIRKHYGIGKVGSIIQDIKTSQIIDIKRILVNPYTLCESL